jgi:nanoRNase/pAp phosphatase (c-di-AMP/oligoRNAs hydrolase)
VVENPAGRMTRAVVVCQSRSHAVLLLQALSVPREEVRFVVDTIGVERVLKRAGCEVRRGSLRDRALYAELLPASMLVISLRDPRRVKGVLNAVRDERGETPVVVMAIAGVERLPFPTEKYPWVHFVSAGERFESVMRADLRLAKALNQTRRLREVMNGAKSGLIVLQDDPDPDALASGLALRTLLGRNRLTMPMVSYGKVTRPENLEMQRVLDLQVLPLTPEMFDEYERVFLVDTQPPHLKHALPQVDAVIDHHAAQSNYEARFKDVRTSYGATATIFVEYLRAEKIKINERLATALLYAIRTDTLWLEQPVSDADVEAFTWLYPRANINHLRRIERPSLPVEMLPAFAAGLAQARVERGVIFSHLGAVTREDVIPQLADFCMQVGGVEWSVVSGIVDRTLSISIRNVGFVQRAGAITKAAFGEFGSAGGRRSMAKAVLPLERLGVSGDGLPGAEDYRRLEERFLSAVGGDGGAS